MSELSEALNRDSIIVNWSASDVTRLHAERDILRAALRPFAESPLGDHLQFKNPTSSVGGNVSVADFRRARDAYGQKSDTTK